MGYLFRVGAYYRYSAKNKKIWHRHIINSHHQTSSSGELRPGSIFPVRTLRLRTHAACGFAVFVIIT